MSLDIIMYHYVRPLSHSRYPKIKGLDSELFRNQIADLKTHYNIVTLGDVLAHYHQDEPLPEKAALLTFDDGYSDHFDYVFPILHDAGIEGSFFIPKCVLLDRQVLDVNKIHFILACCNNISNLVSAIDQAITQTSDKTLQTVEEYKSQYHKPNRWDGPDIIYVKRMLQHALPPHVKRDIIDTMFTHYVTSDEAAFAEELYLTVDQAKLMLQCGMHIGSHGSRHFWYDRLSQEQQRQDIIESLEMLDILGIARQGYSFCYPYGAYNEESLKLLNELGCTIAFAVDARSATKEDNIHTLPRWDANDVYKHLISAKPNK